MTIIPKCISCNAVKLGEQWHYGPEFTVPKPGIVYIGDYCPACFEANLPQKRIEEIKEEMRAGVKSKVEEMLGRVKKEKEGIENLMGAL